MKPLVTFEIPDALMVDYVKARLVGRVETYRPATVSTKAPTSLSNAAHLQVELESGDAVDYPVAERANVRFNVWTPAVRGAGHTLGGRSDCLDAASLIQGLVYSHPGSTHVAGTKILLGRSDVITDPDTGLLMCWFLARVDLKATLLAS